MKQLHKNGYFIGVSAAANILAAELVSLENPNYNCNIYV